jgi:hypothetical protein
MHRQNEKGPCALEAQVWEGDTFITILKKKELGLAEWLKW